MKLKSDTWKYVMLALGLGVFCLAVLEFVGMSRFGASLVSALITCAIISFSEKEATDDPNP